MYYIIQAYLFDAFYSVIYVDENQEENERTDIYDYPQLINECYATGVKKILLTGLNQEYLEGIKEQVRVLEMMLFGENSLEIEITQIAEVIPV